VVAICRGKPKWYRGRSYDVLAPTWQMLKMPLEEYNVHYDRLLAGLDPRKVVADLGDDAIMLCHEKPNVCCHRRRVAEWLETELGIVVPEWGFERSQILPYAEQPEDEDDLPVEWRLTPAKKSAGDGLKMSEPGETSQFKLFF
jgi:hypothetical protein